MFISLWVGICFYNIYTYNCVVKNANIFQIIIIDF